MFSSDDYRALKEAAALLDRSDRGRVMLTGADRRGYLQGLLTNDIAALRPGTGCYAAFLTAQGRMISDMRVSETGEAVLLDLPGTRSAIVREKLEQFIFSEDVAVADVTESLSQLGVYGPKSAAAIAAAFRPADALALDAMPPYANAPHDFNGVAVTIVRSDDFGVDGFDLFVPREVAPVLTAALKKGSAVTIGVEAAEVCRIEAVRPSWGVDMDGETIPLEAGIEGRAISVTKGCYVGQEIIIRVLHRGHGRVARRLVQLALDADSVPSAAAPIKRGEKEVGHITSAAMSPMFGRPIALGYVHRDAAVEGSQVTVLTRDGEVGAEIVKIAGSA
jgi:tRNA-modifying protein YgfZ